MGHQPNCQRIVIPSAAKGWASPPLGIYSIPETPLGVGGVLGKELVLRYTQTTARPYFDPDGKFKGETVSSLSKKIQSGDVKVSDVEIHYVERDGNALIINTRSSIALQKAGVPPDKWNWVEGEEYPNQVDQHLENNGLDNEGSDFVRITEDEEGELPEVIPE